MRWTKTRTPGGAGIKENLLTVWWQCAKQLSQRICVDKSQLPEHLHFCPTVTESWMLLPTPVSGWRHAPPAFHERRTLFRRRPSCLKVSGSPAAVKGAGKDAEDEWHRWPADTSREARLRQMSLVTRPNPAAQRSAVGLSWNQRRLASPQITRVTGLLKTTFSWCLLCSSLSGVRSFVFSLHELFLIEYKHRTIWSSKTFQALLSDAGNKLWNPYSLWGYYCLHKWL